MGELLNEIQELIGQLLDETVYKQKEVLEPLFNQVYEMCHNNENLDIKDMLKLSQLENQLTKRIVDVNPKIEPSTSINANDKIVEQIIYYSRKKIEEIYHCSIKNDSLRARSLDAANIVLEIAKNLEVAATKFNIGEIFNLPFKHYVVIAYLNDFYLIDLTYQQYFLLGYNFKKRYYEHPSYTKTCEVGGRIISSSLMTAKKMIMNGYLKEDLDIKNYFDAFMELSNYSKLNSGNEYLKKLLVELKGSSNKAEKILYNSLKGQ